MDSTEQIKKCTKCGDNKLICQFRKQPKGKFDNRLKSNYFKK